MNAGKLPSYEDLLDSSLQKTGLAKQQHFREVLASDFVLCAGQKCVRCGKVMLLSELISL
jgi:hypothetical protein